MKLLTQLFVACTLILSIKCINADDNLEPAVRAVVKLPTNCKKTKYAEMCKFYKKTVPVYENVEIWKLKDQNPMVTFYGVRDQVVDDVPIWILPEEEWEIVFLDNGLKVKEEFRSTHKMPESKGQCPSPGQESPQQEEKPKSNEDKPKEEKSKTNKEQKVKSEL